ncbi:hypothetical protein IV102_24620 [bacterium]|nr:hypothetical protein [bacterium]
MNKSLGCLAGLLLGSGLVYAGWAMTPNSRYEPKVQELLKACSDRERAQQKLATDVANNAYLDAAFLPYWGRKDLERKPDGQAEKKMKLVEKYSDLRDRKETGLEMAVKAKDPTMEGAFSEFAAFYPKVHKVCNQTYFLAPQTEPLNYQTKMPAFLSLRAICLDLATYSEYLTLTDKPDQALEVAGDSLHLGWLIGSQPRGLMGQFMSMALQSTGQGTLAMVLSNSPRLASQASLEKLSQLLEATNPPDTAFPQALETEFYGACNSFSMLSGADTGGDALMVSGLTLPGLRARELRLFKNDVFPLVEQVRQGQPVDTSWMQATGSGSWLLGRHSWVAKEFFPGLGESQRRFALMQKRQAFLHLYVALALAAHKPGHWPSSLQELQAGGYKPLSKLNLSQIDYQLKADQMELKLTLKDDEAVEPRTAPGGSEMSEWEHLTYATWTLHGPSLKP